MSSIPVNPRYVILLRDVNLLVPRIRTGDLPTVGDFDQLDPFLSGDTFEITRGDLSYICSESDVPIEMPPDGYEFIPVRSLYAGLPGNLAALLAHAVHIRRWREHSLYCGKCGGRTADSKTEVARTCTECGFEIFPRISPAVIVGVIREGKLLLARNNRFTTPMYSILAGFVEPGENLETTIEREIFEEVGIRVTNITYFGSQPWPFPDSLMLGFTADYLSGEISVDGQEIVEANWFSPAEFPPIPPHGSISRRIIDWFAGRER